MKLIIPKINQYLGNFSKFTNVEAKYKGMAPNLINSIKIKVVSSLYGRSNQFIKNIIMIDRIITIVFILNAFLFI